MSKSSAVGLSPDRERPQHWSLNDRSRSRRESPNPTLVALIFGLLWVAIPWRLGVSIITLGNEGLVVLQINLVVSSAVLAWMVAYPVPRFNLLMFWMFVYLFAALAPIAQVESKEFFWPGSYDQSEINAAAVIVGLGVISWCAGYGLVAARRVRPPRRTVSLRRLRRLGWVGIVLVVPVGILGGTAAVLGGRGGVGGTTSLGDLNSPAGILLRGAALVPVVLSLVGLLSLRRGGSFRPLSARVLILLLMPTVIIAANPVSNARYVFGAVSIAVAIAVFGRRGPREVKFLSGSLVVGVLLVFPIADSFRYGIDELERVEFDRALLYSADYDAFQQTMNGMRYVDDQGARYGRQALGAVLVGVPRSVWAEKPEPTGPVIASWSGYSFTNLSSPLWVEGFVDFKYAGTALISVLFGGIAALLDRRFLESPGSVLAILAPIVAGYQTILLRGSLMGVSALLIMWIAIAFAISRRSQPNPVTETDLAPNY